MYHCVGPGGISTAPPPNPEDFLSCPADVEAWKAGVVYSCPASASSGSASSGRKITNRGASGVMLTSFSTGAVDRS